MEQSNRNQLPSGWTWTSIDQLIGQEGLFVDGDWVESKDQDPSGSVRLIQLADIGECFFKDQSDRHLTYEKAKELDCTFLKKGDVLISRLPDPLGRACLFPLEGEESFVTAVDVSIVRLDASVHPKWFIYVFNSPSVRSQINKYKTGTTRGRISRKNLKKVNLPLPPAPEQQRIVAKLEELFSELDDSVANLEAARARLQTYRQSLLKHAFEGRLTEQWRRDHADELESADQLLERIREERQARYQQQLEDWKTQVAQWEADGKPGKKPRKPTAAKAPEALEQEALLALPPTWEWVRLGELFDGKPVNGLYKPASSYGKGYGIIRIDDFYDGVIRSKGEFRMVDVTDSEAEPYIIRDGDILVNRVNSIEYLGKIGLARKEHEGMLFESNMMRIRLTSAVGPVGFFVRYLSSPDGASRLRINAKHAVNQASINQGDVLNVPVPLAPKGEQQEILDRLEAGLSMVEEIENTIESSLKRNKTLRQSILKRAFEGWLVSQDPNDEPASELLARIQGAEQKVQERGERA